MVQHGEATLYGQEEDPQSELDEETQFPELEIALSLSKENLEFWEKFDAEKNFYGLLVVFDYDRNCVEYLPLPTSKDYKAYMSFLPIGPNAQFSSAETDEN